MLKDYEIAAIGKALRFDANNNRGGIFDVDTEVYNTENDVYEPFYIQVDDLTEEDLKAIKEWFCTFENIYRNKYSPYTLISIKPYEYDEWELIA